jgi:hypothetical protein
MLPHNLLPLYEQTLEKRHGLANHGEDRRRRQRLKSMVAAVAKAGETLSTLRRQAGRATQYSVKFLRWLRGPPSATISRKPSPCSVSRPSMPPYETLSWTPLRLV